MTLGSPDSNEIGRFAESNSLNTTISALLNLLAASISAAFTKFVRTKTVFKRTSGTLASSTSFAALALGTNVIGNHFTHSAGVFTCALAGEYRVTLNVSFEGNATGTRGVRLAGSGSLGNRQLQHTVVGSLDYLMQIEWILTLALGDTLTAQAQQNSGANRTIVGDITFERVV